MDAYEAIVSRRSIRKYSPEKVSDAQIQQLLKAAMFAPSAQNQQPWHFIVITEKEILIKIHRVHPYSSMLQEAACAILVCGDENLEKSKGYWPVDCAAATQNILLAGHAIGLGAVWLGVYPRKDRMESLAKLFQLPPLINPFSLISIGHPAEKPPQPERFKKERIHFNSWHIQ